MRDYTKSIYKDRLTEYEKRLLEKRELIYQLYLQGLSYNEISRNTDISPQRVGQLIRKEKKRRESKNV